MAERLTNPLRKAGLTDGIVTVILNADDGYDQPFMADWPYLQEGAGIGSKYDLETDTFSPPHISEPVDIPVPEKVSRFQARAALLQVGLLNVVESFVSQADVFTQLAWKEASEFYRDSPLLSGLAKQLGMSEEQIDDLFRAAAEIRA